MDLDLFHHWNPALLAFLVSDLVFQVTDREPALLAVNQNGKASVQVTDLAFLVSGVLVFQVTDRDGDSSHLCHFRLMQGLLQTPPYNVHKLLEILMVDCFRNIKNKHKYLPLRLSRKNRFNLQLRPDLHLK